MDDSEPHAMIAIAKVLNGLPDDEARRRVLAWAADKHGINVHSTRGKPIDKGTPADAPQSTFEMFADLFDAVRPNNEKEKALAAAYWKSKIEGETQFQSQELNKLLTDLGYKSSNITDALSSSISEKPALILQVRKAGSTRQARKTYKLSEAGARWIEARLAGDAE